MFVYLSDESIKWVAYTKDEKICGPTHLMNGIKLCMMLIPMKNGLIFYRSLLL